MKHELIVQKDAGGADEWVGVCECGWEVRNKSRGFVAAAWLDHTLETAGRNGDAPSTSYEIVDSADGTLAIRPTKSRLE